MDIKRTDDIYSIRHSRLSAALQAAKLDLLVLNAGPSLTYLTGLHFHLSERPVMALFSSGQPPVLVLPELEAGKLQGLSFAIQYFTYGEDPGRWGSVFRSAAQAAQVDGRRLGVEPRRLRVLELRLLEAAAEQAQFLDGEETMAALRMPKDEAEIEAMRAAVRVAQQALEATLPSIRVGTTERQLAAELTLQILRQGSDPEMPFSPIVASGPNSANPHAMPTDRPLAPGDLLILDWGASVGGYFSDLTRTFAIGEVEPELGRIAQIVIDANAAGRAASAPGVPAGNVDRATRAVIEQAGYGPYFTHRTGHGLGLESHEEPYIRADNSLWLAGGMTFTIEPGIYLPGRGGVRVEDNLVITAQGSESLSDLPRHLVVIDNA